VPHGADFTVIVCTRDRSIQLAAMLDRLDRQSWTGFEILVIDQSRPPDAGLAARAAAHPRLSVVSDAGVGLSRSRNLGWRRVETPWIAYLDDDCHPDAEWAGALRDLLPRATDVDVIAGEVAGTPVEDEDYLEVSTFPVAEEAEVSGRWTQPWKIGFGVCCIVRRAAVERLGGWDEHLGVGSAGPFGAAEDMDFNYRFLRAGGRALVTPAIRVVHDQWRPAAELIPLYERYMAGWCGFAMKHLRTGDLPGGIWLWSLGRRRSILRLRAGLVKVRGLVVGTAKGLVFPW